MGLTYRIPPPPEEGISINFGFEEEGMQEKQESQQGSQEEVQGRTRKELARIHRVNVQERRQKSLGIMHAREVEMQGRQQERQEEVQARTREGQNS